MVQKLGLVNYYLQIGENGHAGTLSFYNGAAWTASGTTAIVTAGSWNHVYFTHDGTNDKFYVNGSLQATVADAGVIPTSTNGACIGRLNSVAEYYNGIMDELRFSNSIRGADWILAEYNNQSSPSTFYSLTAINSGVTATPGWPGPTTTFHSTQYGRWNRGSITSEASFDLAANSVALTCVPQPATAYPGLNLGILAAAFNGLFDAATVSVYTAYMPIGQYGTVNGLETKFYGFIDKITDINRSHVEFECYDALYLLNQKIPSRVVQSGCPWSFCDANCTLSAATYTVTFTAKTGSTQYTLTPTSAFTQATGYFSQGVVTCTSGANVGLTQTVKLHDGSGNLEMTLPWLMPVAPGDTYSVIAGCAKTATACATRKTAAGASVNNTVNFGGAIAVPQPLQAV